MATTAVLAGTPIYNTPPYAFRATDQVDWGSADLAATLFTGDLRPEEFDQYLAETRYIRGVTIPMVISGGTAAAAVANTLALTQLFASASRYAPVNFVFTPNGGNASTFKVIGGGVEAPWDTYQDNSGYVTQAVLHLQCLPFVYGPTQSGGALGSSGSPLGGGNQPSPALNTITPSPPGDVPADVTLFVKNRAVVTQNVQTITVNATGGTWLINYAIPGYTMTGGPIFWNDTAASVQSALRGAIGASNIFPPGTVVSVTGANGGPYTATFSGVLALNSVALTADASLLTGGSHSVTITPAGNTGVPIRSLVASAISGNTSWVPNKVATAWTAGADGSLTGSEYTCSVTDTTTIKSVASFTTPALPSDRRFRILIRAAQSWSSSGVAPVSFRLRLVTGAAEAVGEWRTPPNLNNTLLPAFIADMGGYMIPVSEVGSLGAGSTTTTVFLEARGNGQNTITARFLEAIFLPDDSTIVVETSDTGKTIAASGGIIQLETDQTYDTSGNAAGGVITGWQLRVLGSTRVMVYTSQQYQGGMDAVSGYGPENVDVWAVCTPRYVGLA